MDLSLTPPSFYRSLGLSGKWAPLENQGERQGVRRPFGRRGVRGRGCSQSERGVHPPSGKVAALGLPVAYGAFAF
jgi:hypothetical protein